ncbi:mycofactocin precursor MftA [Subtercola endophyticus]|nr:mycofactocin precursor MftA [Subtercola endophyticus]UFS58303.1 mycofactocin precursor MftA [Subtercola endophyticus]
MNSSEAVTAEPTTETVDEVIESDSLVEEVSIDGMCGVY